MTTKTLLKLAAAAFAVAMPSIASATTMSVVYDPNPSQTPNSTLQNAVISFNALAQNPTWSTVSAGRLAFQVSAKDPLDPVGAYIYTFCIEPTQYIANPPTAVTYTVDPVSQSTTTNPTIKLSDAASNGMGSRAALISQLFAKVYASTGTQLLQQGTAINTDVATALQFAIWEIIEETSSTLKVNDGSAQMYIADTNAATNYTWNGNAVTHQTYVTSLANAYLGMLTAGGAGVNGLFALDSSTYQNQIGQYTVTNTPSRLDVPEPGMLGLFGFGAIALGVGRRRKTA